MKLQLMLLMALTVLLSGCSAARLITTRGGGGDYGPSNEAKGGTILTGINSDRKDAYKMMHDFCNGPYKIVSESLQAGTITTGQSIPIGYGMVMHSGSRSPDGWLISFECEEVKR